MASQSQDKHRATTTARQWRLLSELMRKRWRGTNELRTSLKQTGHDVSLRTIQRDLNALATRFPIENNGTTPQGWRWRDDAPVQSMPQMSLSQAVVFALAEQNLQQLLPPSLLDEIEPWFRLARSQLGSDAKTGYWLDNIRLLPATQPLIGPSIDSAVQDGIYEALLEKRKIKACYQKRSGGSNDENNSKNNSGEHANNENAAPPEPTYYTLNPIALIQRGVVMYLLATRDDDDAQTIRMFTLHRFKSVQILPRASLVPEDFNLDEYIASGAFGFTHPKLLAQGSNQNTTQDAAQHSSHTTSQHSKHNKLAITLTFTQQAGSSFLESKLSDNQSVVVDEENKRIIVTASVNPTAQLVWWLRGFGEGLLDIAPNNLKHAVYQHKTNKE